MTNKEEIKIKIEAFRRDTTPHCIDYNAAYNDGLDAALDVIDSMEQESIIEKIKTEIVHAIDSMNESSDYGASWGLEIAFRIVSKYAGGAK